MSPIHRLRKLSLIGVFLLITALLWNATWAAKVPDPAATHAKTTTETLGGAQRYLTHLSTDKPIYRAGESIYMRGVVLHHATRKPLQASGQCSALVEIQGPKGDTTASGYVTSQDSVLGYSWTVPDGQAGGEYTIRVSYPGHGYAPAERTFDIRSYRAPRLKSQIKFLRDGYGPGDTVVATLNVERAEGGVPTDASVTVVARVDGAEAYRGATTIDSDGHCQARFELPEQIQRGEGTLAMIIEDGGVVETASKTIPILLQTVDLTMYPEGGQLVAGLPNRVYFEAFTPAKKPADLVGIVVDASGKQVAKFRSQHEGRGRFEFTPAKNGQYSLKITEPSGMKTAFPLPKVQSTGAVVRSDKEVYPADGKVTLQVGAAAPDGPLDVTIFKREQEIRSTKVVLNRANPGSLQQVSFTLPRAADGVLVATVWNKDGRPLAERLIFRQPAKQIHIKVTADKSRYVPGAGANLSITTTDETGEPVGAVVGLTVTDDSVLEMIDLREQSPRLPVMVLLENDVRELADAHVYLDPENADAPAAVDLLLGTQGWRRFALVRTAQFLEEHGEIARRALALRLNSRAELGDVLKAGVQEGGAIDFFNAPNGAALPFDAAVPAAAAAPVENAPHNNELPLAVNPVPDPDAHEVGRGQGAPVAERQADKPSPSVAGEAFRQLNKELSKDQKRLDESLSKVKRRNRVGLLEADDAELVIRNDFVPVRIYAHQIRSGREPGERIDFTETLFWHAGIKTDDRTGTASIGFGLSDSVTSFRVFADAFNASGAIGSHNEAIESVEPFYLEPKLPLEVTAGDRILLPLGIVNATNTALKGVRIDVQSHQSLALETGPTSSRTLDADTRIRELFTVNVGQHNGVANLTLAGIAGAYSDQITRDVTVRPQGFPIEVGLGGMIGPGATASHKVQIPAQVVSGSTTSRVCVYPTPLASMTEALERLIQEPNGCFEQTSSTTYPLVMAQQYFMSHQGVDPAFIERSGKMLAKGYERLIGFECKSGGFEWFGQDPGHEALSAYGLMEFTDMAQVHPVDSEMLSRTSEWLLGQRDGKGEFSRERRALHTWITEPECSNAYITWALLESGFRDGLEKEVAWVRQAGERSGNTYAVALSANVLAVAGDIDGANHLLDKLAGHQQPDGSLDGASTSIVGSGGDALKIETTALAVLAWLKNPRYVSNVEQSMKYLAESCKAGRFGSTQSTVLALRAIVAYDQSRAKPKAPGNLQLIVDGNKVGQPVEFSTDTQGAIELPDWAELLSPGEHTVGLTMSDGSEMPYTVSVQYNTVKPNTSRDCKLHLECKLRDRKMDEGEVTEANVVVINRTGEKLPSSMAIVGLPGGLEVRHDQLKELVKQNRIAAYEVRGREVVLYWRGLTPEQRVELPISLVAAIPGQYTGPASRAYLYYTDEHKHWVDGLAIEIAPRSEP